MKCAGSGHGTNLPSPLAHRSFPAVDADQIRPSTDPLPSRSTFVTRVRREHVDVPAIEDVKIIDPTYGVAYVRIPVFQKTTARDLEALRVALGDDFGRGDSLLRTFRIGLFGLTKLRDIDGTIADLSSALDAAG